MNILVLFLWVTFLFSSSAIAFDEQFFGEHGSIVGEEYWIFDDAKEGNPYSRKEIIWSYDQAPNVAQDCARKGHAQLKGWLEDSNSIVSKYLKLIGDTGGTTSFYMWTNDYQTNNAKIKGRYPRSASVWSWEDTFLKYESTVLSNGERVIPKESEVIESLDRIANYYEDKRVNGLNFIQRIFDGSRSRNFKSSLVEIQHSIPINHRNSGAR